MHVLIIPNPPLPPLNDNHEWTQFPLNKLQKWKQPEKRHNIIPRGKFPVETERRSTGETGLTFLTRSLVIYNPNDPVDKSTESLGRL